MELNSTDIVNFNMNKASYEAISDPMERMLSRIQEKKLREKMAQDEMEQLNERMKAQYKLESDKALWKRMDDEMALENEMKAKLGLERYSTDNGAGVKTEGYRQSTGGVIPQAPQEEDPIDKAVRAQGLGNSGTQRVGGQSISNAKPQNLNTGIDESPLQYISSGVYNTLNNASNKISETNKWAGPGGPLAAGSKVVSDFLTGYQRYRGTNGDIESERALEQLKKMTPEQYKAYLDVLNRNKAGEGVAPTQTKGPLSPNQPTPEELEAEKKLMQLKMRNSA